MIYERDHFTLSNFEGPLDFLMCLIQKEEIEIYDVPIQELIYQFMLQLNNWEGKLEKGAEFISTAAYLVWLKSKTLLPKHEQDLTKEEPIEDPHFEIIYHLIDYCRFKQAAKELTLRQEKQRSYYFREIAIPEQKKPLGIDHLSLNDLALIFKETINKIVQNKAKIQEENWRVYDKISIIRNMLQKDIAFPFTNLFLKQQLAPEIITTFLAVLELMKIGELVVNRKQLTDTLWIYNKKHSLNLNFLKEENQLKT